MRNRNSDRGDRPDRQGQGRSDRSPSGQQSRHWGEYDYQTSRSDASQWRPQEQSHRNYGDQDYGYGSTTESRDFRNQSEDRYQGAMDFGSHNYTEANPRREPGRFSGSGPKGYKRSDERIKEDVSDMIMRHDEIDGSDIEIEVSAGEVTLIGSVPHRKMKHDVENLADRTMGVSEVHNQLRVKKSDSSSSDMGADSERSSAKGAGKKPTPNPQH